MPTFIKFLKAKWPQVPALGLGRQSSTPSPHHSRRGIRLLSLGLGGVVVAWAIAHVIPHLSAIAFENSDRAELSEEWRQATETEEDAQWDYILNSPLGIAALNQLAIEGFISPLCPKTFYINEEYGGFQSLMKVECPEPQGASTAVGSDEVHVIFNRFESNIEGFEIHRFGQS